MRWVFGDSMWNGVGFVEIMEFEGLIGIEKIKFGLGRDVSMSKIGR